MCIIYLGGLKMNTTNNCLNYETKEEYMSYLKTLSIDDLKKEYYLNINLEMDIKLFYVNIKNYILNTIVKECIKTFKDDSIKDYKIHLLNQINLLINFKNNTIEPYFFELKKYCDYVPINTLDDINMESVIDIYDKIADGSNPEGRGIYNCVQSLINLINNHTAIILHDVLGVNNNLPKELSGFPKILFGKTKEDGSWDYKACLERFVNNCISWFDVIESFYYS